MDERLRQHIAEVYGSESYEYITGIRWQDGTPWQLIMFDNDVDFEGERWRVVLIQKCVYDPDDITAVDYSEDIFSEAWQLTATANAIRTKTSQPRSGCSANMDRRQLLMAYDKAVDSSKLNNAL